LLATLALAAVACAFSRGNPWGLAELTLSASFDPPASRLTPEGYLKTSTNYALRLDRIEVLLGSLTLKMKAGGSGGGAFDPAHPPAGYALCHNGHCHADDGRLVSYEEIAAELAGGGSGGYSLSRQVLSGRIALATLPAGVNLGECPKRCNLERGELDALVLHLEEIRFTGRIFDQLTGQHRRLPADGVAVEAALAVHADLSGKVTARVGRDVPLGLRLATAFRLTPTLYDGIEWAQLLGGNLSGTVDLSGSASFREQVATNLFKDNSLIINLERFEP